MEINDFQMYRMDQYDPNNPHMRPLKITAVGKHPTKAVMPSTMVKTISPIDQFNKGIKRDASIFPILKEGKQFDDWQGDFTTIAESQGLKKILMNPMFLQQQRR